jgi:hypothetical protein
MIRSVAATATALALGASALLAPPVFAGTTGDAARTATFKDRVRDAPRAIDIARVTVSKGKKVRVILSGRNFKADRAQIADTYFDTRRGDAGPEYRLTAFSRNDGDNRKGRYLLATERWAGGKRVHCSGASARFNTGRDKIRLAVPKSCLRRPKAVRVNTAVWDVTDYTNSGWTGLVDYAPAKKQWYPRVR